MNKLTRDLFLTKILRDSLVIGEFPINNVYAFRNNNGVAEIYTTFTHYHTELIIRRVMNERFILNDHYSNIKNELVRFSEFENDPISLAYLFRHAQQRNLLNNTDTLLDFNNTDTYKSFSNLLEFGGTPLDMIEALNQCDDIGSFLLDFNF